MKSTIPLYRRKPLGPFFGIVAAAAVLLGGALSSSAAASSDPDLPVELNADARTIGSAELRRAALTARDQRALQAEAVGAEGVAMEMAKVQERAAIPSGYVTQSRREMALVNILTALRDEPPGAIGAVEDLQFYDLGEIIAAKSPNTHLDEVRVTDHYDSEGNKVGETLGLSGGQIEGSDSRLTVLPPGKGFSSTVRVSSGNSGWVGSSNGSIRLTWIKDRVLDSNSSDDWYVYTVYTRAVPAHHWANRRFVADIDTVSYVTNASAWKVKDDRVLAGVTPHNSNSCGDTVGLGVGPVSYETSACDDNHEKGDRFGGLHSEFRSRAFNCGLVNNCPPWNRQDWNTPVESGFSIQIKVIQGTEPYWKDYGDGFFVSEYGTKSEPST